MRRKGWWQQLKGDEYPKTKTNYGDSRAVRSKPENINLTVTSNKELLKLQKKCPNCGAEMIADDSNKDIASYYLICCSKCKNFVWDGSTDLVYIKERVEQLTQDNGV